MSLNNLPGPVRIFLSLIAWGIILWLLTFGHPALVPIAKFIFIVLVIPHAITEWMKEKRIVADVHIFKARIVIIILAAILWFLVYR